MKPHLSLAALLAAALLLTGCTGGEDGPGPSASLGGSGESRGSGDPSGGSEPPADTSDLGVARSLPVLARLEGTEFGRGVTMELLGVERTSDTHATARFLLTVGEQDAEREAVTTSSVSRPRFGRYKADGVSDVRLVDEAAGEVLVPLINDEDRCLCSEVEFKPEPGEKGQQAVFVTFPAPAAGTQEVSVQVGDFPISAPVELNPPGDVAFEDEPTGGAVANAEAVRLKLVSQSAALDGASRTTEAGDTVAVDVSSDVLFAFGSAELTPKALETLQAVAGELKAKAVGPVEVVGHTDTVGDNDANQRLSVARAQSVQAALQPQTPGLTLTASGRGESEPVVDDSGRGDSPEAALNRRVTVRYAVKPPPPAPPVAPDASVVAPDAKAVSSLSGDGRMFEVLALRRLSDGMVLGTFRLTNTAGEPADYQQDFSEKAVPNPYNGASASLSGLRIVDVASNSAYAPMVDSGRTCLCTELLARQMEPDETTLLYAAFKAPPTTSTRVDISVPSFDEPLTGVPIT